MTALQRLASRGHLCGRDRRSAIAPTCTNEIHDIRHVFVGEPPGKAWHRELRGSARRARRLRPVQHDGDKRLRVSGLYDRIAGEAWEYLFVSNAIRTVARGTIVQINQRP